jgi:hypothetical protein
MKKYIKRLFLLKNPLVILPFVAILVILVAAFIISKHNNEMSLSSQNKTLDSLTMQQDALAKQSLKRTSIKSDVSEVTFKDISTASNDKSSCNRLENRPGVVITDSACDYKLRAFGNIQAAIVFVYDQSYSDSTYNTLRDNNPNDPNSLDYINTFYAQQAKRYNVTDPVNINMTYFGPYHVTSPVDNIYYYNNGNSLLQTYQNTASANSVPESNYDIVEYILLDNIYGGEAFPNLHQNFAYSQFEPAVLAHETLHLFGATDKYVNGSQASCMIDGGANPLDRSGETAAGNDIMCQDLNLGTAIINDVTAREIGWAN